jgi:hypothetical protein
MLRNVQVHLLHSHGTNSVDFTPVLLSIEVTVKLE